MSSFGRYVLGFTILSGGLIYGACLAEVPSHWILAGACALLGAGVLAAVKATSHRVVRI